ncbi:MAG: zinc ribbon domain-containing protein [Alphaproteobacteria bacterium GM202ARS2]|nr:zinc ribbon domain-containing protein [Alphaproteobacteria bacterium GM202ARS2]
MSKLSSCSTCGKSISANAKSCPHCEISNLIQKGVLIALGLVCTSGVIILIGIEDVIRRVNTHGFTGWLGNNTIYLSELVGISLGPVAGTLMATALNAFGIRFPDVRGIKFFGIFIIFSTITLLMSSILGVDLFFFVFMGVIIGLMIGLGLSTDDDFTRIMGFVCGAVVGEFMSEIVFGDGLNNIFWGIVGGAIVTALVWRKRDSS